MTLDVKKDRPMKEALIALFAKENRKFFLWGIGVFFVVLVLPPSIFTYITGENNTKLEFIKLIGWGMSGLIAILGVMGLFQRAAALDKQNEMTEKGHIHERFKVATEHLGSEHISVRIAAFNEFYHLAEIESNLRKTIFDILCAHLRQTTKDENYQKKEKDSETQESTNIKPTEEVQSLLNILFKPHNKNVLIFGGMNADLAGANLQGANLEQANLQNANLLSSNMEEVHLQNANLQKANLVDAKLIGAYLLDTNLQEADMNLVNMRRADLQGANLQKADMLSANLQNANLQNANLKGAFLQWAEINKQTTMPDSWKDMVEKDGTGKTSVCLVDNEGGVIKSY